MRRPFTGLRIPFSAVRRPLLPFALVAAASLPGTGRPAVNDLTKQALPMAADREWWFSVALRGTGCSLPAE